MRIVLAPTAYKGALGALEAVDALAHGVRTTDATADLVRAPVSDGGDSFLDVLADALRAERRTIRVAGPLADPVDAAFAWVASERLAIIEMARAAGLTLIAPPRRDPMKTTTRGVGELISGALDLSAQRIIIGLGGSATVDGGLGAACALGLRAIDTQGHEVGSCGGDLERVAQIDASALDERLANIELIGAADVTNPLLGARGAARVFGPQKGADADDVERLERGLARLHERFVEDLGADVADVPGAGAAGGLGAGLAAMLGARLTPGIDVVLDAIGFDSSLRGADLVLTGEGSLDAQSVDGKAVAGVCERARRAGVPVVALAGRLEGDLSALHDRGLTAAFSICDGPLSEEEAMRRARDLLGRTAARVVRLVRGVSRRG